MWNPSLVQEGKLIYFVFPAWFNFVHKYSENVSFRVIEMGLKSFPEVFHLKGMAQEVVWYSCVLFMPFGKVLSYSRLLT